jgi:hypothetical protein
MAFYTIDLTTRAGARSAAFQGSVGALIFAVLALLGFVLMAATGFSAPMARQVAIGAVLEMVVALIAAVRLRQGKGAYWGIAAAILLMLELLGALLALSPLGVLLKGVALALLVQGIRGALALKRNAGFEDDDLEVFR